MFDDRATLGLPIRLVVLTIVGMVGLASILSMIASFQPPKSMHAEVKDISGSNSNVIEIPANKVYVRIEVSDSKDLPVEDAAVALRGLGIAAINRTDHNGSGVLELDAQDIEISSSEGYLSLEVSAKGFLDYGDEYAVKVVVR